MSSLASVHARSLAYPFIGLGLGLLLWWLLVHGVGGQSLMAARFSPENTWSAAVQLWQGGEVWDHAWASLRRVALGLACALLFGVPLGLLVGSWRDFNQSTSTLFQFLRMISPLSWMPVAVMALGVGEAPVVFLLAFAAVWPIVLNVSAGIAAIDPQWLTLADSLGANRREKLWRVTVPAIAAHLLTGIRLAIGLIWVVLVPAEMLGVNAGLGYFILDTRDRMAYGELMATILFIGLLGFVLDWLAREAHRRWAGQ
ncbi:ABC transporter permease [Rhodocyclus tenuis]|uniref:NitT/TauT family transport system permease protein n=1 Tax=Rhodocyclus tenuis TaxID=1066 RepID=A0A840GKC0_RHOTE|nr:ABC transporter permease [Rhodocyclus tenuis]MBB4248599.1 NitT/TauT family transport system permease protein [Rhodocyclus tenuis]